MFENRVDQVLLALTMALRSRRFLQVDDLVLQWGGLSLGIRPERIMPGRPGQNGRHERMHRTLKAKAALLPRENFASQPRAFDGFLKEYHPVRPHEALAQQTPSSADQKSNRPYPKRIPDIDDPAHFEVLKTDPNGVVSFGHTQWIVRGVLKNEWVSLEEMDHNRWKVYFGPVALGHSRHKTC